MKIAITGASGFIGRRLMKLLAAHGHRLHVLSRHAGTNLPAGVELSVWDPLSGPAPEAALRDADAVLHLAGEPVAQRWTAAAKQRIHDSRVTGTRHLVAALANCSPRPAVLVCASAIGYYGSRGDELLTEDSSPGAGFLADLCVAWEREAGGAEALGMRVTRVRIGLVLDMRGGALKPMLAPFRAALGGPLGGGRQWMSWVHSSDLAEMLRFALERPAPPVLNGVAPGAVTNADFTRALAAALHRPAFLPMPKLALRMLFGEMAELLLASQRVAPVAAEAAGFEFQYRQLTDALADILRR
ncbi:MAG: TIGR01777 family oxidoreductase [Bryobacteraceae bacterium]